MRWSVVSNPHASHPCWMLISDPAIREELDKLRKMSLSAGPILFIGMGASYCSSISGSSYLQSCGRSSFTVDAGEWLHYSSAWEQVGPVIVGDNFRRECGTGATVPKGSAKTACTALQQRKKRLLVIGPEQTPDPGGARVRQCHQDLYQRHRGLYRHCVTHSGTRDGRKTPSGCYGRTPPLSITYSVCETRWKNSVEVRLTLR